MFDNLSEKLQRVFKNLRGEGRLTAENMEAALREIRVALLEADVHFRVVKQLEAGIVWVNHMQPTMLEAPWGGYKMSGFGRELGHWGVEEYLETKQVYINLDEAPIAWY